ncbi:MAG: hypothetical protein ACLQVW_12125 [Limisphaerales bacterium]
MKRMTLLVLLLIGSAGLTASGTQGQAVTFYVQLIRGTDAITPPSPEARLVGPALDQRLRVFKWRNYWETIRRTIVLKPGSKSRQRLTPQREVEIALTSPQDMTVSIYKEGKLSRRRKQAANTAFFIAGGDRDNTESWFIVVRRDNPEMAQANLK